VESKCLTLVLWFPICSLIVVGGGSTRTKSFASKSSFCAIWFKISVGRGSSSLAYQRCPWDWFNGETSVNTTPKVIGGKFDTMSPLVLSFAISIVPNGVWYISHHISIPFARVVVDS